MDARPLGLMKEPTCKSSLNMINLKMKMVEVQGLKKMKMKGVKILLMKTNQSVEYLQHLVLKNGDLGGMIEHEAEEMP